MNKLALFLVVIAATLQFASASAQDAVNVSRKEQIEDSSKKVKELQQERIDTLKEMVATTTALFHNGRVEFDEVIDAQLLLLQAELEVAEKDSDRIALYTNTVETLRQYEQLAEVHKQRAQGTHAALLKIKARRLEAEIHLEQAKAKVAQDSK